MPELPDLTVYLEHLNARTRGHPLACIRLASPFVLRTAAPPPEALAGRTVLGWSRLGKQLVARLDGGYALVIHLMISGRLRWERAGAPIPVRVGLAAFDFAPGTLVLVEASRKHRAALRLIRGADALAALDPGGSEVLEIDAETFASRIGAARHTLKRALTDQHLFAGIGNAYSDEILHRARLSPFRIAATLSDDEARRLFAAVQDVLRDWTARLRADARDRFPRKVTALHPDMAVHGRYRQPCPDCGTPVQRIRYVENECNYCPRCQTGGRLLADRALSRLLREDWPKRIEDLE
jgi:formamidopyrimidine-DNA glycosylase